MRNQFPTPFSLPLIRRSAQCNQPSPVPTGRTHYSEQMAHNRRNTHISLVDGRHRDRSEARILSTQLSCGKGFFGRAASLSGVPKRGFAGNVGGMGDIVVTVSEDYLGRMDDVAEALRENGMQIREVLPAVGVIYGSLPGDESNSLEALAGVQAVTDSTSVQLPPPDSPIQ